MMRPLLHENELLAQLAWSHVLLAFDFDGTLAPIVADRRRAEMRARTSTLFAKVSALYPCAVISGRSKADVEAHLGGAPVKYIVGNHGLEPGAGLDDFEREIARAHPLLAAALGPYPGLEIEDKRYSLAIHYRRSRQKRNDRAAIQRAVASLRVPVRLVQGKMVVNLVPEHAPNKGEALLRLRTLEDANIALYVGDDVTDEDVFTLDQPGRLVTVRVGQSKTSAAKYFLRHQRDIDAFLARLVSLRANGVRQ